VEICSSVRSIKYAHKYVYKGHDCCNVEVVTENDTRLDHDEINVFSNVDMLVQVKLLGGCSLILCMINHIL